MATYQININERTQLGKGIITLLRSAAEAVSFEMPDTKVVQPKSTLYKSLESGFKDVREILDGKQKEVTLDEFLNEL
ncbi:hypothetical protein AGMMS50239_13350 [Bacteroidia bacterium]|nr:hypothetical protein AGMMS50239_13350 [Bacteroidia bacterium]